MTSRTTASFRKAFAALPGEVQDRAREAFRLFSGNPAHPSLQFKQVHTTEPIFSARITLDTEPWPAAATVTGSGSGSAPMPTMTSS